MSEWSSRLRRHGLAAAGIMIGLTLMAAPAQAGIAGPPGASTQIAQVQAEKLGTAAVKVTRSEMLARARAG
nr:hypothetical protein GCM10017745_46940 [Saccharothrix mutabilis subsp. capreolus]